MTKATKPLEKKKAIDDCTNRNGYKCVKLNKTVAIDARDIEQSTCWGKENCKYFEVKNATRSL